MVAQFIHATQYTCPRRVAPKSIRLPMRPDRDVSGIDELVMMRAADKGDLYVHQGERSERERAAIGKAGRDARDRPATCPQGDRTTRSTGGANFNVIGVILDTRPTRSVTVLHTAAEGGPRVKDGSLVERYVLTPYGELTVHQLSSYGDGDVDATDKGTPGTTCTGTPTGACRILDLDFDGDYDATDATLFDNLDAGNAVHPGRRFSALGQPFGHQGLWLDAEAGQYQNRARRYDPATRRFLQRETGEVSHSPHTQGNQPTNGYIRLDVMGISGNVTDSQMQDFLDGEVEPKVAPARKSTCRAWDKTPNRKAVTPGRTITFQACVIAAHAALDTPFNRSLPPARRTWCYECKRVTIKIRGVRVILWELWPWGCRGSCITTPKPLCRPSTTALYWLKPGWGRGR